MSSLKADRFMAKLTHAATTRAPVLLMFAPRLLAMPLPIQRYDDPFLPFAKAIIDATRDGVCGYVFDLAAYLALGAAGAVALERTFAYAGGDGETVTVLHAPFVGGGYAAAAGETAFNVDAVTLASFDDAPPYLEAVGGAFVMQRQLTATPEAWNGAGVYLPGKRIMLYRSLTLTVLGEEVLYAGRDDDFAQAARSALIALKEGAR